MGDILLLDLSHVAWRILAVLASSTAGLVLASVIHYAFFEEVLIYRGSAGSNLAGRTMFVLSIMVFLGTVYVLHLNRFSPIIVSFAGMFLSKLTWNLGDAYSYANRLLKVLSSLDSDEEPVRSYLSKARTYRQIQDLRAVAQTMYARGSARLARLDALIDEIANRDD